MSSPVLTPVPNGGTTAPPPQPQALPRGSYAAAASKPRVGSRLAPIQLVHRSPTYVDNVPGLLLIALEEEQLFKQRENTLIMKLSSGIPRLQEIRDHIASEWQLENNSAVGYLDPRDGTLHMASVADSNRALARTTNKINNSLFRLFVFIDLVHLLAMSSESTQAHSS